MKFATPAIATSRFLAVISLSLAATSFVSAQSVTTDPVGFVTVTCTNNSDTIVSIPLTQPPAFVGGIASVSGSTITLSGTLPGSYGYTAPQPPVYYALIGPNPVSLAGTVSTGSGSQIVTGVGTNFTTAVSAGDGLLISGSSTTYSIVQSIASDTSLTVTIPLNTTSTGLSVSDSKAPKEGNYYTILSSGSSTVTVNTNGDDLSTVQANTQLVVIPYWTLTSVFPDSAANVSYTPTTVARTKQTEILLPDNVSPGVNLAPTNIYYYFSSVTSGTGWRLVGDDPATSHNNEILPPDSYFTVRNQNTATSGTLTMTGNVYTKRLTIPLATQAAAPQDNAVAINRPVDVALNNLGLSPNNGSFLATTVARFKQDELLVFDNTQALINKSPSAIYYYINITPNVGWRLVGDDPSTDHGSDVIAAGTGLIVRKAASGGNGPTAFWPNSPTY